MEFSRLWYSHKWNGPALRYEVALSVHTGNGVWIHGPWLASIPDIPIFPSGLRDVLQRENEFAVTDNGYADLRCVQPPGETHPLDRTLALLRARHENFNKRLKHFNVLSCTFRHDRRKHSVFFHAVVNVTKVLVDHEPLFAIALQ